MFTGTGTALVTPFRRDGSLDEPTLRALIKRQIDAGIDFLVPCGTTGESPTLTHEEHLRVVEIAVELAKGRVPVLAGAGGYNTAEVIALASELAEIGADGILSVTPYYNKPTQEGLYQHYKAIAAATTLPIVVYSVQGRTGVNVEPATVRRLAAIENIVGIKEASGNISQMAAILNAVPDDFIVLSGDDAITLPLIALGGRGVISVVSNEIPGEMARLTHLALDGDFPARARNSSPRASVDGSKLRRVESRPGESGDGANGLARSRSGVCRSLRRRRKTKRAFALCWIRSTCSDQLHLRTRPPRNRLRECMLPQQIERLFDEPPAQYNEEHFRLFREFKDAVNRGEVRAAEPDAASPTGWRVNAWVKKGILLGFRMGAVVDMSVDAARQPFIDKSTYPAARGHGRRWNSHRTGRLKHTRWLVHRAWRCVHAADVRQRRRVCRRRHDD